MTTPADPLAARLADKLRWHEAHPHVGETERISVYKQLVLQRMRAIQWEIVADRTGQRPLEIGCGVGRETVEFAERGVLVAASDLSPALVEIARAGVAEAGLAGRVARQVSAAERLTAEGCRFDVVIGNSVLHHLDIPVFKREQVQLRGPRRVTQTAERLIHNLLLRFYRALTPRLRPPDETPLSACAIEEFVAGFPDVRVEYANFTGLLLLPALCLVGRMAARAALDMAARAGGVLFRCVSALRRYSQYTIIQVSAPAASAGGR